MKLEVITGMECSAGHFYGYGIYGKGIIIVTGIQNELIKAIHFGFFVRDIEIPWIQGCLLWNRVFYG